MSQKGVYAVNSGGRDQQAGEQSGPGGGLVPPDGGNGRGRSTGGR